MEQLPEALDGHPVDWTASDATRAESGFVARIKDLSWHYGNQI